MGLETAICRLIAAGGLGLLIGLERELHGRSAGLRTQVVVSVCACLLMILSLELEDVYLRIYLDFDNCGDRTFEIKSLLEEHTVKIIYAGMHCSIQDEISSYELAIRLKSTHNWEKVMQSLRKLEGLTGIRLAEGYVP